MIVRPRGFADKQSVLLLAAVCCLFCSPVTATAESRVALVALSEQDTMRLAIELATVELAQRPGFVVLERQEIRRVLREQDLALRSGASGEQAIALGRLLSVDVFAVCSLSQNEKRIQLVVYETATGVRLIDRDIEATAVEKTAAELSANIDQAIKKRESFHSAGLHLISFHGHRNVDLPISNNAWVQRVLRRLQQEFTASEQLAVLERSRLRFVNEERMLPTVHQQARLMAASTYLLFQFSRSDNSRGAMLTLVLYDPSSTEPKTFSEFIPFDSPEEQLARLIGKVEQAITQSASSTDIQRLLKSDKSRNNREVNRLRQEARRLYSMGEWERSAAFCEAVFALQPENHRDLDYLIFVLDYFAKAILKSTAEKIKQPNNNLAAVQTDWLKAIHLLEYRLHLIELLHARRKNEPGWHMLICKHNSNFPPWHVSLSEFKNLDAERMPLVVEPLRAYCRRFHRVWFEQIMQYAQEHVEDANEAYHFITEKYHQGRSYLKLISDPPEQWPSLFFEQYDSWRGVLRKNGWDSDAPSHVKVMLALNKLLDVHEYDLRVLSNKHLVGLKQRFEALSQHPSDQISFPARLQVARMDIHLLSNQTQNWQERNDAIARYIDRLTKQALAQLAEEFPPPSADDIRPFSYYTLAGVDYDHRILRWTFYLQGVASLHSDYTRRREKYGQLFEQCMELNIFSPRLFFNSLPPHVYNRHNHSAIGPDNLPARIAAYEKTLPRLRAGIGKRATLQLDKVIQSLQVELEKDRSLLARFQGTPIAVAPWTNLRMLAGRAGFPEKYDNSSRVRVLGFAHRAGDVYHLLKQPSSSLNEFEVSAFRVDLADPEKIVRLNHAAVRGNFSDLPKEQRKYYDTLRSTISDTNYNRVVVDENNLYWNRISHGILVMPLDGSEPFHFDEQTGLPSNFVQCIVAAQGKVFAWVGRPQKERILVAIHPKTKKIQTLASSERATQQNQLDNRGARVVELIYFDSPKNRVLFLIGQSIWSWNLTTKDMKELLRIPWKPGYGLFRIISIPHRNALLVNRRLDYLLLDLSQDTWQTIPLDDELTASLGNPATLLNNQVWIRNPWGRYNLSDQTFLEMQLPLADQAPPTWWHPLCEVLNGEKQCLIWDEFHLWLAELSNDSTAIREE